MATWGNIKTLVQANLGRQGESNVITLLPIWADIFQKKVQRDRRYWFLKNTGERTIDERAQTYPLPTDFRTGLMFYLRKTTPTFATAGFSELTQIGDLDVVRLFAPATDASDVPVTNVQAEPRNYVVGASTVTLWPWPDMTYILRIQYWKDASPPLAASVDAFTNAWITDYPDLYEQELTAAGCRYLNKSQEAIVWEARAMKTLNDIRAANVARELAGPGKLSLTPNMGAFGNSLDAPSTNMWRLYR